MSVTTRIPVTTERIEAWKGIAVYFGRDERTVKRWERERGLPVRRMPGERGGVFAYRLELEEWLHSAKVEKVREAGVSRTSEASGAASQNSVPSEIKTPTSDVIAVVAAAQPELAASQAEWTAPRPDLPLRGTSRGMRLLPLGLAAAAAVLIVLYTASATLAAVRERSSKSAITEPKPEAKEAYLMGRYYWSRRTDGSLKQAVDAFTQAVVHDPGYARAYAGLAESYDLMPEYSTMSNAEAFPRAIVAAKKAIELDGSLAEAHRALAFGEFYWEWKVGPAEAEYKRAIALAPADEEAHHWYATALLTMGRLPEAKAEIERARELEPTSRSILADGALIGFSAGDVAANIEKLRSIERSEPDFIAAPRYLARIYLDQRNFAGFLLEADRAAKISGSAQERAVADAASRGWAFGGERGMLEAMRVVQKKGVDEGQASGFDLAHTCALLGDKRGAMDGLEAAFRAHDYMLMTVFGDDTLRGFPPFEALKVKIRARMNG